MMIKNQVSYLFFPLQTNPTPLLFMLLSYVNDLLVRSLIPFVSFFGTNEEFN